MSDFDKEAERERLREKYEQDQERREAAQRMSDLLLKGATMTNAHCGDCGSPIFRNQGDEFCPTCGDARTTPSQEEVDAAAAEQSSADDAAEATGASGEAADAAGAGSAADVESAVDAGGATDAGDAASAADAASAGSAADGGARTEQSRGQAPQSPADQRHPSTDAAGAGQPATDPARGAAGDAAPAPSAGGTPNVQAGQQSLATAQQELLAAIVRHARAADGAEPRVARDHLAAAREAAEALSAISR